ncbi:MAG: hypothetical protein NPIRA02_38320 [Nitrospirales bacterium]|nr:MAG: hypothetical protein NPIRA02_38320 [Nitrospirales bacterium]
MDISDSQHDPDTLQERLRQEAIEWQIRLTSGESTSEDLRQCEQWQTQSQAHKQAWKEVSNLWKGVETLGEGPFRGATPLKRERSKATRTHPPTALQDQQSAAGRWIAVAATIMIGLAVIVGLATYPHWMADYTTGVGERRTVSLPDGTRVELNSQTAVNVRYTSHRREIELLSGQAFFAVEPDAQRPFLVRSGKGITRAVGTEFLVDNDGVGTQIAVLEGEIEVKYPLLKQTSKFTKDMVGAYDRTRGLRTVADAKLHVLTAWREGYLIFDHTPLSKAITAINRHRSGTIVLLDTALAEHRVNGIFQLDALENAVAAIEETTPATIVRITPYFIFLH